MWWFDSNKTKQNTKPSSKFFSNLGLNIEGLCSFHCGIVRRNVRVFFFLFFFFFFFFFFLLFFFFLFFFFFFFFFQAEDGIRDLLVTGVQTCALPILGAAYRLDQKTVIRAG